MKKLKALNLVFCSLIITSGALAEPESKLTISGIPNAKTFSRSDLLKMKSVRAIEVEDDPAYNRKPMRYEQAVLASELFDGRGVTSKQTISFKSLDGFAAPIAFQRLLNKDKSKAIAYVAIEDPKKKWPTLKNKNAASAGPFYLIWENPKKSNIGIEEWPYQLAGFEVSDRNLEEQFPNAHPGKEAGLDTPIGKGYTAFMKNCFACHAMNGDGGAKIGPDLNLPESAADYLKRDYFFKLVRNPQSLRAWAGSKMSAFDKAILPDEDLANIWLYLGYMSKRKAAQKGHSG